MKFLFFGIFSSLCCGRAVIRNSLRVLASVRRVVERQNLHHLGKTVTRPLTVNLRYLRCREVRGDDGEQLLLVAFVYKPYYRAADIAVVHHLPRFSAEVVYREQRVLTETVDTPVHLLLGQFCDVVGLDDGHSVCAVVVLVADLQVVEQLLQGFRHRAFPVAALAAEQYAELRAVRREPFRHAFELVAEDGIVNERAVAELYLCHDSGEQHALSRCLVVWQPKTRNDSPSSEQG